MSGYRVRKYTLCAVAVGLSTIYSTGLFMNTKSEITKLEKSVEKQLIVNETYYEDMVKKIRNDFNIKDKYVSDFDKIYRNLVEGLYGDEEGEEQLRTLFKIVQDSNTNLESEIYLSLQSELSTHREDFDSQQADISKKIKKYNAYIDKHFIVADIIGKNDKYKQNL